MKDLFCVSIMQSVNVVDPRRAEERRDFNMIHPNKEAVGNLPTECKTMEVPPKGAYFRSSWE